MRIVGVEILKLIFHCLPLDKFFFEPIPHSLRKLSMGLRIADLIDSKLMVTKAMAMATNPAIANTNHPIETL